MFKSNILLKLFLIIFLVVSLFNSTFSQKDSILTKFYKLEQQNWKEHIISADEFMDNQNYDVLFYHLDLDIAINSPYIKGNVKCNFKVTEDNTNSIEIDLKDFFTIDSITGNASGFTFSNDILTIQLDSIYNINDFASVTIYYHGVPQLAGGLKGLRYTSHQITEPVIASLSTPFLAHYWYPCKDGPGDKPDSVYVDITIPDTMINNLPLIAVSNGTLDSVIISNNKKTFQWRERYPIVPYYVMIAISNYKFFQQTYFGTEGEEFPLDYYVFNEDLIESQQGVEDMPEVMYCFSQLFGTYPFKQEKYGMTQLGFYGAIENQTNTIINSMNPGWFNVSVHELGHMWFGDMITCKDWHHGWLNEGFATYSEALWTEYNYGFSAYQSKIATNEFRGGGTLYLQDISDPFNIFISIIYDKGAFFLHMLRGVLGDDLFFQALKEYSETPELRYNHAATEDFQQVCENVSGEDLSYFFDQWIYDEYYPKYEYSLWQDDVSFQAGITINQVQHSDGWRNIFKMPIDLLFNFSDGSDTLITVWNDEQNQNYIFDFTNEVSNVTFDPDNWILKDVEEVISNVNTESENIIKEFSLEQNYPNPFNPITTIKYSIPELRIVSPIEEGLPAGRQGQRGVLTKLVVYDLLGNEIKTLVNEQQTAGNYQIKFDGLNLPSGIYFIRMNAGIYQQTIKAILLK